MLDSFTVEGESREEVVEKVKKRHDYNDTFEVKIEQMEPKGLLKFFKKKKYWVGTYVIKPASDAKKKAMESARYVLQNKGRELDQPSAARQVLRKNPYISELSDVKKAMAILEQNKKISDIIEPSRHPAHQAEQELLRSPAVQIQVKVDNDERIFSKFLSDRDIEPDLVTEILSAIRQNHPVPLWKDQDFNRVAVKNVLPKFVKIHGGVTAVENGCRYVMFVGPTGVGKTTTLVKVSTGFYRQNRQIRFITNDDYRIGATDQLRCYADIMSVPMDKVSTPEQFFEKIKAANEEIIFVDTAGRNPRDSGKVGELIPLLESLGEKRAALESYLVLSANMKTRDMQQIIRNFSTVNLTAVIFTKVDEAMNIGGMLSVLYRTKLPVAYITHGQGVPEDVTNASNERLIELLFRE